MNKIKLTVKSLTVLTISACCLFGCSNQKEVQENSDVIQPATVSDIVTEVSTVTTSEETTKATTKLTTTSVLMTTLLKETTKTEITTTKAPEAVTTSPAETVEEENNAENTTTGEPQYISAADLLEQIPNTPPDAPVDIVDNPEYVVEDYDKDAYEKLGIKVKLTGTNEEMAQQYYNACVEAYPDLPWGVTGSGVSIDISSLRSETSIDVSIMQSEEIDALINEKLAGRDYHDLDLYELYELQAYTGMSELGIEISKYFNDLTGKDFVSGGWTAS